MSASGQPDRIALDAPAKINLHLGIYPGHDERGYHRVDSIMICLDLANRVSIARAETPSVSFEPPLGIDIEKSVVYRAVCAFADAFTPWTSYGVHVERIFPGSAGLGSSSADAGTALRGMALMNGVDLDDPRLVSIAHSIGADVAFFLKAEPALLVGAGDVHVRSFEHVDMPIVLVKPQVGVSTAQAYATFDADPTVPVSPDGMVSALLSADVQAIAENLYNNLAPAACTLAPEVGECVAWLRDQSGVLGAQVTGSGSCSFAICESDAAAQAIASASPWWACATRTISR